jgi:hypothetical protein
MDDPTQNFTPHERYFYHGIWFRLTRGGLEFDLAPNVVAAFLRDATGLEREKLKELWDACNPSGGVLEKGAFFTMLRTIACMQANLVADTFHLGQWQGKKNLILADCCRCSIAKVEGI